MAIGYKLTGRNFAKTTGWIPELSRMVDPVGILWLDEMDVPHNSPLAERYHELLKQELGIDVVASHACIPISQLVIHLWITKKDPVFRKTEVPEEAVSGDKFCDCAVRCLKQLLAENDIFLPSREQLLAQPQLPKSYIEQRIPDACLCVYSYEREIYNYFMHSAKDEINQLIRRRFAYWDVECMFTTTESFRVCENQKHIFMFRCQYDIEHAKRDGILDTLLEEAYKIVKKHDKHGTVTRETYDPDIVSRDRFSGEMLFNMARD